jgi:heme-degrading monooxygenase HmoA
LPAISTVHGYLGAMLLEQALPNGIEILVIAFWRSVDSLRDFAGADLEGAVVAEEAAALSSRTDAEQGAGATRSR